MGSTPDEVLGFGNDGFDYTSLRGVALFGMYVIAGLILNVLF